MRLLLHWCSVILKLERALEHAGSALAVFVRAQLLVQVDKVSGKVQIHLPSCEKLGDCVRNDCRFQIYDA